MKDIEYEKNGVKKFASERFKDALEAVGWSVVKQSPKKKEIKPELLEGE